MKFLVGNYGDNYGPEWLQPYCKGKIKPGEIVDIQLPVFDEGPKVNGLNGFRYQPTPYYRDIVDCMNNSDSKKEVTIMKGASVGSSFCLIRPEAAEVPQDLTGLYLRAYQRRMKYYPFDK